MEGDAISLVCIDELELLNDIEALLRQRIPDEIVEGFELDRQDRPQPIPELRGRGGRQRPTRGAPRRSDGARPDGRSHDPRRTDGRRPDVRPSGPRPTAPHATGHRSAGGRPAGARPGAARPNVVARDQAPRREGTPGSFVAMPGERFTRDAASS